MKIIRLPYYHCGEQFSLLWHGYRTMIETHSVRIFTLNQEYLSTMIIDWDIISMMDRICADFPEYDAIEQAAAAHGPVVALMEAKLKTDRIRLDQIPFVIESTFFASKSIKALQYVNAGEDRLGYRVVFRFAKPLQKTVSEEDPPVFNPEQDRVFIVGDKFIID